MSKILTRGFIWESDSYLRDNWNRLDFLVVFMPTLEIFIPNQSLVFIEVLRLLRILRPLRFISKNPQMKLIVNALL